MNNIEQANNTPVSLNIVGKQKSQGSDNVLVPKENMNPNDKQQIHLNDINLHLGLENQESEPPIARVDVNTSPSKQFLQNLENKNQLQSNEIINQIKKSNYQQLNSAPNNLDSEDDEQYGRNRSNSRKSNQQLFRSAMPDCAASSENSRRAFGGPQILSETDENELREITRKAKIVMNKSKFTSKNKDLIRKTQVANIYKDNLISHSGIINVREQPNSMPVMRNVNMTQSMNNVADHNMMSDIEFHRENNRNTIGFIIVPNPNINNQMNQLSHQQEFELAEQARNQPQQMYQQSQNVNALTSIANLRNNFVQNTDSRIVRKQFIEDCFITLYLFICVFLSPKDENYEPQCMVQFGSRVANYFTFIQLPMFALVSIGRYLVRDKQHDRTRGHNQQRALRFITFKYLWLVLGLSEWSIHTTIVMLDVNQHCFQKSRLIVIINFFIISVIGFVISILMLTFCVCCFPMLITSINEIKDFFREEFNFGNVGGNAGQMNNQNPFRHQNRREYQRSQKLVLANTVINALVHRKFSSQLNDRLTECCICMENFTDGLCDVTPLSHNQEHYFHTKCLEEWLKVNTCCPICRTEIKADKELEFRQQIEKEAKERPSDNNC